MKNETKFSDEEIQGIVDKVSTECANCSMTTRQVMNMAKIVDNYNFNNSEDRLLALEYASMIRSQILFYINHVIKPEKLVDYRHKQYLTMDGITKRVIMAMYPEIKFDLYDIDDKQIKTMIDMLLSNLRIDINNKESKNDRKDFNLIIKKRIGL